MTTEIGKAREVIDVEPDDVIKKLDVPLTCTTGELEDWFAIERREHNGRSWFEPLYIDGKHVGASLCLASRIGNADIEGTADDMRDIARAIAGHGAARHKRCAVETLPEGVVLWSPRNSIGRTMVPQAVADALAAEIFAKLGGAPLPAAT